MTTMEREISLVIDDRTNQVVKSYITEDLAKTYISTRKDLDKNHLYHTTIKLEDSLDFKTIRYIRYEYDISDIINISRKTKSDDTRLRRFDCGYMDESLINIQYNYSLTILGDMCNPSYHLNLFKTIYDDRPSEELHNKIVSILERDMDAILDMRTNGSSVYDIKQYIKSLDVII